MIHLIVLRSADEESESEESYEELVTKALGEENCVLVWPGVFLADSKLTGTQIKDKLGMKSGGLNGMIASIETGMLAGIGPTDKVQWYHNRSS